MFKLKKELTNIEKVIFYRQHFWGLKKKWRNYNAKFDNKRN